MIDIQALRREIHVLENYLYSKKEIWNSLEIETVSHCLKFRIKHGWDEKEFGLPGIRPPRSEMTQHGKVYSG